MRETLDRTTSGVIVMRKLRPALVAAILTVLVIGLISSTGCIRTLSSASPPKLVLGRKGTVQPTAVYLRSPASSVLTTDDLNAHDRVAVVLTERELQSLATTRVAIWRDTYKAGNDQWLQGVANRGYPVAVIGDSSTMSLWPLAGVIGVPGLKSHPGFSVWMLTSGHVPGSASGYLRGFEGTPTVGAVLKQTDALLRGESL